MIDNRKFTPHVNFPRNLKKIFQNVERVRWRACLEARKTSLIRRNLDAKHIVEYGEREANPVDARHASDDVVKPSGSRHENSQGK